MKKWKLPTQEQNDAETHLFELLNFLEDVRNKFKMEGYTAVAMQVENKIKKFRNINK